MARSNNNIVPVPDEDIQAIIDAQNDVKQQVLDNGTVVEEVTEMTDFEADAEAMNAVPHVEETLELSHGTILTTLVTAPEVLEAEEAN